MTVIHKVVKQLLSFKQELVQVIASFCPGPFDQEVHADEFIVAFIGPYFSSGLSFQAKFLFLL